MKTKDDILLFFESHPEETLNITYENVIELFGSRRLDILRLSILKLTFPNKTEQQLSIMFNHELESDITNFCEINKLVFYHRFFMEEEQYYFIKRKQIGISSI